MSRTTAFGPGTLTIGTGDDDFACEVIGGKVTHAYDELRPARRVLCGTEQPATQRRTDGLGFELVNDLTSSGLYSYLLAHDLAAVPFTFTPNTDDGASWAGTVVLTLPGEIGAAEYGEDLTSSVEWAGVGTFTHTPSTPEPAP